MGFSFRSMFQPSADQNGQGEVGMSGSEYTSGTFENGMSSAQPMHNIQAPPLNGSSPFGAGSPLFRTVSGESMQATPVQVSPFAAQNAAPTHAPLTVGDVLPQLPPEMVRTNALSPDQPVAISGQILDAALRSGQAALPIFEIYRVCPALFQTPVSPQDPRMVPLPASKLPRLIASAQQAATADAVHVASPFGISQQQQPASPFAASMPGSNTTTLPPRRNGPPPPLADIPREGPASLSLPSAGNGQVFPASPFAAAAAQQASPMQPPASPFAAFSAEAKAPSPGVFAPQGAMPASPFNAAGVGAGTPASPFAAFGGGNAEPPAKNPAPESPFATLFGQKAVPTGQPAPDAPVRPPGMMSGIAAGQTQVPASGGQNQRVSLATFLRGYSVAELGFDPIMVPSWIVTSLPVSMIREWSQSASPLVELGTLIDGVTDVGFRNVLNHAKRDFQLKIPHDLISTSAIAAAPPTLPNLSKLGGGNAEVPPQGAMTMRVEPPTQMGNSPFAVNEPASIPATFPAQESAFMSSAKAEVPQNSPAVPLFSPAKPVSASQASEFQGFPPSQSPQQPLFTPSVGQASPMPSFQMAAPAPLVNPFAAPAAPPAPTVVPQAPPPPTAQTSPPAPVQPFHPQPPAQSEPPRDAFAAPHSSVMPQQSVAFQRPPDEGLSSAELLGNSFGAASNTVPPAPAIPVTNPFTGKEATHIVDVEDDSPPPAMPTRPEPRREPAVKTEPKTTALFTAPVFESEEKLPASRPMPTALPSKSPASRSNAASPALGISSHDTNPDQILLRALLGTDDELSAQRIVEMVCSLPGIAACVCLHGGRAISHVGAHKPQAREFQRQATDLAHHLRTLAPLIGIDGAETFTLTSGDRLMTFCFPEGAIMGVLHDAEPSLGLRDKITLIARELSRMLD